MSSENRPTDPQSPFRRNLLLGSAALSATALLPPFALAQQFPTAKVNTTGLAVTDTEITVGGADIAEGEEHEAKLGQFHVPFVSGFLYMFVFAHRVLF